MPKKDRIISLGERFNFLITRENQTSGLTYYEGENEVVDYIKDFYKDLFNLEFVPEKDIRGYKKLDRFFFKFVSGHGYNIFDRDLLNYNGIGALKNVFLDYVELIDNKNDLTLSKIDILKQSVLIFLEYNKKFNIKTPFILNESFFETLEKELKKIQKKEQTFSI